jgi:hypothetical protein
MFELSGQRLYADLGTGLLTLWTWIVVLLLSATVWSAAHHRNCVADH